MKLTFAYWGNYTIAFIALLRTLGVDFISPEKTNTATIEEGAKLSPSMYCFPLKVNMGNYLSSIRKGADTVLSGADLSRDMTVTQATMTGVGAMIGAGIFLIPASKACANVNVLAKFDFSTKLLCSPNSM